MDCRCSAHNGFLTAKGLEEAAQRSLEGLDAPEVFREVDTVGSVSALDEPSEPIFVDAILDRQYRRFLSV